MAKTGMAVRLVAIAAAIVFASTSAHAQADEIQVYDGGLAEKGVFNLTIHNNYTPNGIKVAAFPGAVVAHRSWNGVPEFAYGVNKWFEAGLYLPLYSLDEKSGFGLDGFKLRGLVAMPNADSRRFVLGVGMELGFNAKRWDTKRVGSEIRPIIGWHLSGFDILFNPIINTSFDTFDNLVFVPSARVARNLPSGWALAVEEYADFGRFSDLSARRDQAHQVYGVVDHTGKTWDIEAGVGFGVTPASDKLTFKLIVARDLYTRKSK